MEKVRVLFVCMGNICRSPTAQGVFEHHVRQSGSHTWIQIDSAGTHAYHIGSAPDQRSQAAARERGIDLSSQRARQVQASDFDEFDYILAMDSANLSDLQRQAKSQQRAEIRLLMEYATLWNEREVPDPYYGGTRGFEKVLDMIEDASKGLLAHLVERRRA